MDPVNGISQIIQILRQKLGERSSDIARKSSSQSQGTRNAERNLSQKASPEEIKRRIGARIRALSQDERQGPKATQIFVESIITWELGEHLLQDPRFAELSKDVVRTISEDNNAKMQMRALLADLQLS